MTQHRQTERWTPDAIVLAIQQWARENDAPPAQADWNPHRARVHLRDEDRARRFERGRAEGAWPSFSTVVRRFGSWNAALRAAGFEPRPPGSAGRSRAAKPAHPRVHRRDLASVEAVSAQRT